MTDRQNDTTTRPTAGATLPAADEDRDRRFERIVAVHIPALSRVALRMLRQREMAEDVVQETLLRAWRHLDQLRDATAARGWLFMILRNESARACGKAPPRDAGIDVDTLAGAHGAVDIDAIDLHRGVEALPDAYRAPLELFAFGGCAVEEIAATLGLGKATVKTRLFRARGRLRDILAHDPPPATRPCRAGTSSDHDGAARAAPDAPPSTLH